MKKLLFSLLLIGLCVKWSHADALSDLGNTIKDQFVDQTRITILSKGGPVSYYDMSVGNSSALRLGYTSHVLTNRWLYGDASWLAGTDGHVAGILVGGVSINGVAAMNSLFPTTAAIIKPFIPAILSNSFFGFSAGWGTDNGAFHYGVHLGTNF